MSVSVGTLTIDLNANTASFSQSMDKMSQLSAKTATDIKKSLEKIAAAGAAMAAAITTGTVALIKGALDSADAMGKMAQSAGTTTETLSVLNYAAGLSNVGTEQLGKGLEKLSVAAFKAQNGNSQLSNIFAKLGVTITDSNGRLKDSGLLMEELAVKFSKMGDSSGKSALAIALFGKAGAALIPMLNQYGSEQEKITQEAQRFGLVLGTSTAEVAMKAHDNLDRLGFVMKGIGFSVLSATLPALDALLQKLVDIAKNADMQGLANDFGSKVTTAVNLLGDALSFAAKHATALKVALEALAAVQVAKIAIPVIGDLAGGGFAKVGDGVTKMLVSFAGLGKVIPQLTTFAKWIQYNTAFIRLMAAEEGIAAAATYVLDGAMGALGAIVGVVGAPILIAVAAIGALIAICYKFRDSTFSIGSSTYKLKDTWNAAWILMGKALSWVGSEFGKLISGIKSLWTGLVSWLSSSTIANIFGDMFGKALSWAKGVLGALTPGWVTDALDEAKRRREQEEKGGGAPPPPGAPKPHKDDVDTSGMGKTKESPVDRLMANLQEKLAESKQTLVAAGLEEEAQRKVTAANKANNEIVKLGEEIAKQRGIHTKDYASLVDAETQATIRNTEAQLSDNEAKAKVLDTLGQGERASALAVAQSALMTAAMDKGSDAVTRQNALTQAWNELRSKGASLNEVLTRSQQLYTEAVTKETVAVKGNIIALADQLKQRQIVTGAMLGTQDQQDAAALKAKLQPLDRQIDTTPAGDLRDKLIAERDAIIKLNEAEKDANDLAAARAMLSPEYQYKQEAEQLESLADALRKAQGGQLTNIETMKLAAAAQDNYNRLTDETVSIMLRWGNAKDGVTAFLLEMQKQAQSTAAIIYEAMSAAFTKLSENLTQLVTGGKTSFAKMFEDVGRQMVNSTIQTGLQKGLGALGPKGGPLQALGKMAGLGGNKAPTGTEADPMHVKIVGGGIGGGKDSKGDGGIGDTLAKATGGDTSSSDDGTDEGGFDVPGDDGGSGSGGGLGKMLSGLGGLFKGGLGGIFGKLGGMLSGLFKGGGGGMGGMFSSLFSALIPHATGGAVSPDSAYLVGEQGPEILTGASGNIMTNSASRRALGATAGPSVYYTIDARGTDPAQTEQRTRNAILASHNSAVVTSLQAGAERKQRVPPSRY